MSITDHLTIVGTTLVLDGTPIAETAEELAAARTALIGLIDEIHLAERLAEHPWTRTGMAVDRSGDLWVPEPGYPGMWRHAMGGHVRNLDELEHGFGPMTAVTITPETAP